MTYINGLDHNPIALLVAAAFMGNGLYYAITVFIPDLRPKPEHWRYSVNNGPWKIGPPVSLRSIFIAGVAQTLVGLDCVYFYTGRTDDFPQWVPFAIFFAAVISIFAALAADMASSDDDVSLTATIPEDIPKRSLDDSPDVI